jgi:aspartyl protease family protein
VLRTYIIIALVLIGFAVSLTGRLPDRSRPGPDKVVLVGNSAQATSAPRNVSRSSAQSINELDRSIELKRDDNGYFYADVQINGAPVHMLIDTGATVVALSRDDAHMAGIATSIGMNDVVGQGADGVVKGEQVTLDRVTLGDKTVEQLPAIVLNSGGQSLLGQSFLGKFASVKIEGDKMVLR